MNLLSLDYGLKHIGLAISHGVLAEPLTQFENNLKTIQKIREICEKENIEKIIIGISEGGMAEKTKDFARELKETIKIPVILHDETLTSKEASRILVESGAKKKKRQTSDHQIAAALILQSYLEEN